TEFAVTDWLTTSDSWSPKFRYASRYIRRSASESSCWFVSDCGMHVPPPPQAALKDATGMLMGPVNVVFAGVAQSTWNFQRFSLFAPKFKMSLGAPAGGSVAPSRSDGSRPPYELLVAKH